MQETNDAEPNQQDAIGLIGLAFAIAGIWEMPLILRLSCFVAGAVCLPVSFARQPQWPLWVRWLFSIIAVALLAGISWSAIKKG